MKTLIRTQLLLMTALVAGSSVALAQTSGTTGTSTMPAAGASQPTTSVGVTPQTAAEANRKAVPRSDTATVVRTSPNAADTTRNATGMNNTTGVTNPSGTSGMNTTTDTTNASGTSGGMRGDGTVTAMRKARADRN